MAQLRNVVLVDGARSPFARGARGKLVAVWVFRAPAKNDTPELWAAMRDAGVDFFTSNLPHELTAWRTAS